MNGVKKKLYDDILYDYLLHYNPYRKDWVAIDRNLKEAYFNGELVEKNLIRHEDVNQLIAMLSRTKST